VFHENKGFFGGDGLAFVLHRAPNKWTTLGPPSSGNGYAIAAPPTAVPAISPSFAIEIDCYDNSPAGVDDISRDHIAMSRNGVQTTMLYGPVNALTAPGDVPDGSCRPFRIVWKPATDSLLVYFNGALRMAVQEDIRIGFGGLPVYFGFTGSSGGRIMQQTICYDFIRASRDTTICASATLPLAAQGGTSYTWSPAANLSATNIPNPVFTPPATGSYAFAVTGTNALGCTETDSVRILVAPTPSNNPGPYVDLCQGDSIQIGAAPVPGLMYSWSPSNGLSNPNIANPMAAPSGNTWYYLTVTDPGSGAACTSLDSMLVTVWPLPTADAGSDTTICMGGTAQFNASGGANYRWLPPANLNNPAISNPIFTPPSPGTYPYAVEVSFNLACRDTDTVVVHVTPLPIAIAGPDLNLCAGDSVQIGLPPQPNLAYLWSPAATLDDATRPRPMAGPAVTTNYDLVVTDTSSPAMCSASDQMTVTVFSTPVANAGPDTAICTADTLVMSGSGGGTYHWFPAGGLSDTAIADPVFTPPGPGNYIFALEVFLNPSCRDTDIVVINLGQSPTANAGPNHDICLGDTVMLGTPGPPNLQYQWSPTAGLTASSIPQPLAFPSTTTQYTLFVTNTATTAQCDAKDTMTVTVDIPPPADAGLDDTICVGTAVNLGAPAIAGLQYAWSPGTYLNDSTVADPVATPTGTIEYELVVTQPGNDCESRDTVEFVVLPLPVAAAGSDSSICGADIFLYAQPALNGMGAWIQPGGSAMIQDSLLETSYVSNLAQGANAFVWTVSNGICADSDSVTIHADLLTSAEAGPDTTICGNTLELYAMPPAVGTGLWDAPSSLNLSDPSDPNASVSDLSWGTNALVWVAGNGTCTDRDTLWVTAVAPVPTANAGPDQDISGNEAQLAGNPAGPGIGTWTQLAGASANLTQPNNPNSAVQGLTEGNYVFVWTITSPPCLPSADEVALFVGNFSIPSGFSPNDDGKNDIFVING
ncbi:MAG: hypothetical protein AAF570_08485, partial [Bacteroidota bacterium]